MSRVERHSFFSFALYVCVREDSHSPSVLSLCEGNGEKTRALPTLIEKTRAASIFRCLWERGARALSLPSRSLDTKEQVSQFGLPWGRVKTHTRSPVLWGEWERAGEESRTQPSHTFRGREGSHIFLPISPLAVCGKELIRALVSPFVVCARRRR